MCWDIAFPVPQAVGISYRSLTVIFCNLYDYHGCRGQHVLLFTKAPKAKSRHIPFGYNQLLTMESITGES